MVLLMPNVAADLDGVSPLLPGQIVVGLEVGIVVALGDDGEVAAGNALEGIGEIALRSYVKSSRLGAEAGACIQIAELDLIEQIRRDRIVETERGDIALAEAAGGFGLEIRAGQGVWKAPRRVFRVMLKEKFVCSFL